MTVRAAEIPAQVTSRVTTDHSASRPGQRHGGAHRTSSSPLRRSPPGSRGAIVTFRATAPAARLRPRQACARRSFSTDRCVLGRTTPRSSRSAWTTRAAATSSGSRVIVRASQSTYDGSNAATWPSVWPWNLPNGARGREPRRPGRQRRRPEVADPAPLERPARVARSRRLALLGRPAQRWLAAETAGRTRPAGRRRADRRVPRPERPRQVEPAGDRPRRAWSGRPAAPRPARLVDGASGAAVAGPPPAPAAVPPRVIAA